MAKAPERRDFSQLAKFEQYLFNNIHDLSRDSRLEYFQNEIDTVMLGLTKVGYSRAFYSNFMVNSMIKAIYYGKDLIYWKKLYISSFEDLGKIAFHRYYRLITNLDNINRGRIQEAVNNWLAGNDRWEREFIYYFSPNAGKILFSREPSFINQRFSAEQIIREYHNKTLVLHATPYGGMVVPKGATKALNQIYSIRRALVGMGLYGSADPKYFGPSLKESTSAEKIQMLLEMTPVIGTILTFIQSYTGKELITGRKLEDWERALNVSLEAILFLVPFVKGGFKSTKGFTRGTEKLTIAEQISRDSYVSESISEEIISVVKNADTEKIEQSKYALIKISNGEKITNSDRLAFNSLNEFSKLNSLLKKHDDVSFSISVKNSARSFSGTSNLGNLGTGTNVRMVENTATKAERMILIAEVEITKKEDAAIRRLQETVFRNGDKWDDLSAKDRIMLGNLFHKYVQPISRAIYQGTGEVMHNTQITQAFIATARAEKKNILVTEAKVLIGGKWKRIDLLELNFKAGKNELTLLDLTSLTRAEHIQKTQSYRTALSNLTNATIHASEMHYVGTSSELLEFLTEKVLKQAR